MSSQPESSTVAAAKNENEKFALKRETVRSLVVKTSVRTGKCCGTGTKQGP